jgi:hypothetical protein
MLFVTSPGDSVPDADLLAEASAAFRVGIERRDQPAGARAAFLRAAHLYERLHRRGADNAELNRNLGNACLLAGDLPRAILAYRRGLRFAPADRGLQEGLAAARSQVAFPQGDTLGRPPVEQRPPWLPRFAAGWYLALAFVAYTCACLAAARWWMLRRGRLLALAGLGFLVALVLLAGLVAEEWRDNDLVARPLVVIADDGVLLRNGNGLRYPPRYETPLNRGVEARLLFVRGDWLQIELNGGEVGWVPREYTLVDKTSSD